MEHSKYPYDCSCVKIGLKLRFPFGNDPFQLAISLRGKALKKRPVDKFELLQESQLNGFIY